MSRLTTKRTSATRASNSCHTTMGGKILSAELFEPRQGHCLFFIYKAYKWGQPPILHVHVKVILAMRYTQGSLSPAWPPLEGDPPSVDGARVICRGRPLSTCHPGLSGRRDRGDRRVAMPRRCSPQDPSSSASLSSSNPPSPSSSPVLAGRHLVQRTIEIYGRSRSVEVWPRRARVPGRRDHLHAIPPFPIKTGKKKTLDKNK